MVLAALLGVGLAHAGSEIGDERRFGLGLESGATLIGLSGKYWFNDRMGLTAVIGTSFVLQEGRLGFESQIRRYGESWSFAQVPLYWHVGVEFAEATVAWTGTRVGVDGGVGAAFQLAKVPVEVYAQGGLAVYPVNTACQAKYAADGIDEPGVLCAVGVRIGLGARYYF